MNEEQWDIITWAELEAARICQLAYRGGWLGTGDPSPHDDADRILALADRIRAERAAVAAKRQQEKRV